MKLNHYKNIRNHKMHEKLTQLYKISTLEFLCKSTWHCRTNDFLVIWSL